MGRVSGLTGLLAEYGFTGTLTRLAGTGETWRVDTADGRAFVLKRADDQTPPNLVALEHEAVDRVARTLPSLGLPRFVRTRDDRLEGDGRDDRSSSMRTRLLSFVPGTPWCEAGPASAARHRELGRLVADVDLALAGLDRPAGRRTHHWNLADAGPHRRRVPFITDSHRRAIADRAFALWASAAWTLPGLPHGLIHGDANDENVLVMADRVIGLLDFGDLLWNPLVCDLAIALAYAMLDAADPLPSGADIVGAYGERRALQTGELRVLFPLVMGRLAVTVSTAAERRTIDPNHPTWFVTEARAWRLLERLDAIDPADAGALLSAGTGIDPFPDRHLSTATLRSRRDAHISSALSVSYRDPLAMVRGSGAYLFDHRGRPFLDLVNNVCHVGHCHPRVVEAGRRQMGVLNTNTRYLSELLPAYAERLSATLPPELDVCFFVNSGSEANELALRLAMTHTGRHDVLVGDAAYHGNTRALVAVSPYKFLGRGGSGRAEAGVHLVPTPDAYRGPHRGGTPDTGAAYGDDVGRVIRESCSDPAAFLIESLPSCGGQIVPPPGYLETAFRHVRNAGGVCIVDEVQTGFGRVGRAFWGFELQGVVPDIVVLGKPMGNGHPMGAVVTTRAIAASFENGMEFFSSFGGNPVSCAIGLAVLDVLRDEDLQARARETGTRLCDGLRGLMASHPLVGDVRGEGLFIGVELVRDRTTLEPAAEEADELINRLRHRGLLASTDGPHHNVVKIKPPLAITNDDADLALRVIAEELP